MIQYIHPKEENIPQVVKIFNEGFKDYMILVRVYQQDRFVEQFFEKEQYSLEHSILVLERGRPIGLTLVAIKEYKNVMKARVGCVCVVPEYRRKKIAQSMMEKVLENIKEIGVKEVVLEVLCENEKAYNLYKKLGFTEYKKIALMGASLKGSMKEILPFHKPLNNINFKPMSVKELTDIQWKFDISVPWQSELDYIQRMEKEIVIYGAYFNGHCFGWIVVSKMGGMIIRQIWIHPKLRRNKIASFLLNFLYHQLQPSFISTIFYEEEGLKQFFSYHQFRNLLTQYEMRYTFTK